MRFLQLQNFSEIAMELDEIAHPSSQTVQEYNRILLDFNFTWFSQYLKHTLFLECIPSSSEMQKIRRNQTVENQRNLDWIILFYNLFAYIFIYRV